MWKSHLSQGTIPSLFIQWNVMCKVSTCKWTLLLQFKIVLSRFCSFVICFLLGTAIAILTVLVLVLRLCITDFAIKGKEWSVRYIQLFVSYFIIGVTVLVVAVPEGLPLAVTLALAYSVQVWNALKFLMPLAVVLFLVFFIHFSTTTI